MIQENRSLRICGETAPVGNISERFYLQAQIPRGVFDQTIELPFAVKENETSAVVNNGILKISLTKTVAANVKKVAVSFK